MLIEGILAFPPFRLSAFPPFRLSAFPPFRLSAFPRSRDYGASGLPCHED